MASIITLKHDGKSEIEISKSVFIGHAKHVTTPEEAISFVDEIKSKYPDARHNCYAWIVSGDVSMQKYSDDGEPQGTAGMPMLSCLTKKNITNAAVVVTRYFGGILLGKGGLVRAYSDTCAEALLDAEIIEEKPCVTFAFNVDYSLSERITYDIKMRGYRLDNIEYGADVRIFVTCLSESVEEFTEFLTNATSGKVEPEKIREFMDVYD